MTTNFTINPIGYVKSKIKDPIISVNKNDLEVKEKSKNFKSYNKKVKDNISELIILPEYIELLYGIEEYSHILVLYWPHLIDLTRRNLKKVHPMGRSDLPLKGIFATCSPIRPNPILVSAVELIKKTKNSLKVKGLEAVNESPIIDIKPYNKFYYGITGTYKIAKWLKKANDEFKDRPTTVIPA